MNLRPTDQAVESQRQKMRFTLEEKLRIVTEALGEGVRQIHVSRKYGLGKNTLARWKQILGPLCLEQPETEVAHGSGEQARLLARIAELERLLGQRTLELDGLRQRLLPPHNPSLRAVRTTLAPGPRPGSTLGD